VARSFFADRASATTLQPTVVILHNLALSVEQLCARSLGAPSVEELRPTACGACGRLARDAEGALGIVGHGLYSRQVRGLVQTTWMVIWVRRYLCRGCGHTMSRLPNWLHPWRWYAATVIIEALFRHLLLSQSARLIGVRFGRPAEALGWRSLRRWRGQLLVAPTLWGWLGPRLGARVAAATREAGRSYLRRLLAEGGEVVASTVQALRELSSTVRATLRDLVHNRKQAWLWRRFPPGASLGSAPTPARSGFPTEKGSGTGPP